MGNSVTVVFKAVGFLPPPPQRSFQLQRQLAPSLSEPRYLNSTMCPSRTSRGLQSCALLDFLPGYQGCFCELQRSNPEVCFVIFTIYETDVFINALKEILKDIPTLNSTMALKLYRNLSFFLQIDTRIGKKEDCCRLIRAFVNLNLMTSLETDTPQMSPSLKNEVDQHSSTQEKETTFTHKFEGIQASLPPSFTALLTDCCAEVYRGSGSAQSNLCEEVDLKSQIVRYMEDSSFQDMLIKVEKVISEIGSDLTL